MYLPRARYQATVVSMKRYGDPVSFVVGIDLEEWMEWNKRRESGYVCKTRGQTRTHTAMEFWWMSESIFIYSCTKCKYSGGNLTIQIKIKYQFYKH